MNAPEVLFPSTLGELARILRRFPDARLVGGGTLEIPSWAGNPPRIAVYLPAVQDLAYHQPDGCGAAHTLAQVAADSAVPAMLRVAAASIGSPTLRTTATVGGNVVAARPGCFAVALLALDARVQLLTLEGCLTTLPLSAERPRLPLVAVTWRRHLAAAFHKVTLRAEAGPALATVAVSMTPRVHDQRWIVAVGGTGAPPHRLYRTEQLLSRRSAASAEVTESGAAEVTVNCPSHELSYRRHLVGALLGRGVRQVLEETGNDR